MSEELEGLSISQAALMLGVPVPTIRSWERRYGVGVAVRTQGSHRRYDLKALAELRDLRDAIAAGRRAGDAATLIKERSSGKRRSSHVDDILNASTAFDTERVRRSLEDAAVELGLFEAIDMVVLPALREIGSLWEAGKCDVANEHLASQEVRAWLSVELRKPPRRGRGSGTILLACGPDDHHTIGLEAFYLILTRLGWRCRILGAQTPSASAVLAARESRATAVVISSHLRSARKAAIRTLQALDSETDAALFFAGNAFLSKSAREGVPGTYLGEELHRAATILEEALHKERSA